MYEFVQDVNSGIRIQEETERVRDAMNRIIGFQVIDIPSELKDVSLKLQTHTSRFISDLFEVYIIFVTKFSHVICSTKMTKCLLWVVHEWIEPQSSWSFMTLCVQICHLIIPMFSHSSMYTFKIVHPYTHLDLLAPMPAVELDKSRVLMLEGTLKYRDNVMSKVSGCNSTSQLHCTIQNTFFFVPATTQNSQAALLLYNVCHIHTPRWLLFMCFCSLTCSS